MKPHPALVSILAFSGLSAVGVAITQAESRNFRYEASGKGSYEIAGVCNADPNHITCWKPTGESDPKLAELVSAYFLLNSQHLEIRYEHRSLMVITRSNNGSGISFYGLQTKSGGQLNQGGSFGFDGNSQTMINWYYPPDDVQSAELTATLRETTSPAKLPLKVNGEVKLEGGTVRITAIEKADEKARGGSGYPNWNGVPSDSKQPHWLVTYALTGEGAEPIMGINASALDLSGNMVNHIDSKGNPDKPPMDRVYNGIYPYFPMIQQMGANQLLLAVNPQKLSALQITGWLEKKVPFTGIALQPR